MIPNLEITLPLAFVAGMLFCRLLYNKEIRKGKAKAAEKR